MRMKKEKDEEKDEGKKLSKKPPRKREKKRKTISKGKEMIRRQRIVVEGERNDALKCFGLHVGRIQLRALLHTQLLPSLFLLLLPPLF